MFAHHLLPTSLRPTPTASKPLAAVGAGSVFSVVLFLAALVLPGAIAAIEHAPRVTATNLIVASASWGFMIGAIVGAVLAMTYPLTNTVDAAIPARASS